MSELQDIREAYNSALALRPQDVWTPEFVSVAALSCKLPRSETPLMTAIIAAPGTGKTEIMKPFESISGLGYSVSDFTSNAFVSGSPTVGHSMFTDADKHCICLPDLTPLMDKDGLKLNELLSALRTASDGKYDKNSGARDRKITVLTHISVISAVTEAFYFFMEKDTNFGQRFLALRHAAMMDNDKRRWIAKRALRANKNPGWRARLCTKVVLAMESVRDRLSTDKSWGNVTIPSVDDAAWEDRTISLSNVLTYMRSASSRAGIVEQEAEMPTRSSKQFQMIQRLRCVLDRRTVVSEQDYELSRLVATGSLTPSRFSMLKLLFEATLAPKSKKGISIPSIHAKCNARERMLTNIMACLQHNKVVERVPETYGEPQYCLSDFMMSEIMASGFLEGPKECS